MGLFDLTIILVTELAVYYLGYRHGKTTLEEDIHNITLKNKKEK